MMNKNASGKCATCAWRNIHGNCDCEKLHETGPRDDRSATSDHLIYCYDESGAFWVGPEFGCVHWRKKT